MSDHHTTPGASRGKSYPAETIEQGLDEIHRRLGRELDTPQTSRDAATYQRLADLHRREAIWWKEYLATAKRRLAWLAASAAADRARQLAMCYQEAADKLRVQRGDEQRVGRAS